MRLKAWALGVAAAAGFAAPADAQYPDYPYPAGGAPGYQMPYPYPPAAAAAGSFMPNYYNRQNQPLSPYLNLLRGGSPGVNYYYGVRPGTTGGAVPVGG